MMVVSLWPHQFLPALYISRSICISATEAVDMLADGRYCLSCQYDAMLTATQLLLLLLLLLLHRSVT